MKLKTWFNLVPQLNDFTMPQSYARAAKLGRSLGGMTRAVQFDASWQPMEM